MDKSTQMVASRKFAEQLVADIQRSLGVDVNRMQTHMRGFVDNYEPVSIKFENLSMTLKKGGKCILEDVSGEFGGKSMVAIMGPSGGGKTTFMNALCGRAPYADIGGKVWINGVEGGIDQTPTLIGYVPQEDIMFDNLTVYQNLYYSAMLRLPTDMAYQQKLRIIEDVLLVLDLDHIKNTVVGNPEKRGISGGQKKRVNIGLELVAYPRVLFLDEPTTGLDSSASGQVAKCLARLRALGMTVICVIHQPRFSVFRTFNDVLLLGKGGRTVYIGPTGEIQEYMMRLGFSLPPGENVADWFIDVVCGQILRMRGDGSLVDKFDPSDLFAEWKWEQAAREDGIRRDVGDGLTAFETDFVLELIRRDQIPDAIFFKEEKKHKQSEAEIADAARQRFRRRRASQLGRVGEVRSHLMLTCPALGAASQVSHQSKGSFLNPNLILAEKILSILDKQFSSEESFDSIYLNRQDVLMLCHELDLEASTTQVDALIQILGDDEQSIPLSVLTKATIQTVTTSDLFSADSTPEKLVDRPVPGRARQLYFLLSREVVGFDVVFYFVALLGVAIAGWAIGIMNRSSELLPIQFAPVFVFSIIGTIMPIDVFAKQHLQWKRERETGMSTTAYVLSKLTRGFLDTLLLPVAFAIPWYYLSQPIYATWVALVVFFANAFYTTGCSHFISVIIPKELALLVAAMFPAIFVSVFGGTNPTLNNMSTFEKIMAFIGPGVYTNELLTLFTIKAFPSSQAELEITGGTTTIDVKIFLYFLGLGGWGIVWRTATWLWIYLVRERILQKWGDAIGSCFKKSKKAAGIPDDSESFRTQRSSMNSKHTRVTLDPPTQHEELQEIGDVMPPNKYSRSSRSFLWLGAQNFAMDSGADSQLPHSVTCPELR